MCYMKAKKVLPIEVIELIQKYVEGEYIYIPRKECNRQQWGTTTNTRKEINLRSYEYRIEHGTIFEHHCYTFSIDGSEQPVRKSTIPLNDTRYWSSKKNMHSINTILIVSLDGRVLWKSKSYPGNACDKTIMDEGI